MRQNDALENFIVKAKKIHGNDRFDYTISREKFKAMNQDIAIKCNVHNVIFLLNPYNHLKNTITGGCPTCKTTIIKSNANDIRTKSMNYFIETSKEKFGDLHYDYTLMEKTFVGTKKPFQIRCLKHNEIVTIKGAANHVKTKYGGCFKCTEENIVVIGQRLSTPSSKISEIPLETKTHILPLTLKETFENLNQSSQPNIIITPKPAEFLIIATSNNITEKETFENLSQSSQPNIIITPMPADSIIIATSNNIIENQKDLQNEHHFTPHQSQLKINIEPIQKIEGSEPVVKKAKISDVTVDDRKKMLTLLKEYQGECKKCTNTKMCTSCNNVLKRIKNNNFTHLCQWIIPKTQKKCGFLLKAGDKTCVKHAKNYNDAQDNIKRCGFHGCQNILEKEDKYYCRSCNDRTNKANKEKRRIKNDSKSKPQFEILPSYKRWLSGFFDGDGSIYIGKQEHPENPNASTQYILHLDFTQKVRSVLEQILRYYPGGNITVDDRSLTDEKRNNTSIVYKLRYNGYKTEYILKDLLSYSIIKFRQLQLGLKYIECMKTNIFDMPFEKYYTLMQELKNPCHEGKPYERLCYEYIAGLLDAEGCVHSSKKEDYSVHINVSLAQKQDIGILESIAKYYGFGYVRNFCYIISNSSHMHRFLESVYHYTYVKTDQIKSMFQILETIRTPNSVETNLIRTDANTALKIAKEPNKLIMNTSFNEKIGSDKSFNSYQEEYLYLRNHFKELYKNRGIGQIESKKDELAKLKSMYEDKYYIDQIFNEPIIDIEKFEIELIFIHNASRGDKYSDIWNWYKVNISSLRTYRNYGKYFRVLVREKHTAKYIGLLAFTEDYMDLKDRDKYIKWNQKQRQRMYKHLFHISCCLPLQPFGYNFNGGKLLASLCFSQEVYNFIKKTYNINIAGYTTMCINGKGVMYDRLKYLKHVGYTTGTSFNNIPSTYYDYGVEFMQKYNLLEEKNSYPIKFCKPYKIRTLLTILNLDDSLITKNVRKGIYFGYTGDHSNDFLLEKRPDFVPNRLYDIKTITYDWFYRWCATRITNISKSNRFKTEIELYKYDLEKYDKLYLSNLQEPRTQSQIQSQIQPQILELKTTTIKSTEKVAKYREKEKKNNPEIYKAKKLKSDRHTRVKKLLLAYTQDNNKINEILEKVDSLLSAKTPKEIIEYIKNNKML